MLGCVDVRGVRYWGCGTLGICDVGCAGCWGCGMLGMWYVRNVGCSGCRMFAGIWDVDLQNAVDFASLNTEQNIV